MNKSRHRVERAEKGDILQQVAALPYRLTKDGQAEILVITSRETRRFTIPKGWQMKQKSKCRSAAIEAEEEAGIRGKVGKKAIGNYFYWKRMAGVFVPVRVKVFPLRVRKMSDGWKECEQRMRRWLSPQEASLLIDEPELVTLLRNFSISRKSPEELANF